MNPLKCHWSQFFLFHFIVLVLVKGMNGRFLPHVKFLVYLFFLSVIPLFSIFLHQQFQGSKLWSREVLLRKYFTHLYLSNLSFSCLHFPVTLLQNSVEHGNCVAPFQAFSKLTRKHFFKKHVNTRHMYYKPCTHISIVLTVFKVMPKLKCFSAYYWICL